MISRMISFKISSVNALRIFFQTGTRARQRPLKPVSVATSEVMSLWFDTNIFTYLLFSLRFTDSCSDSVSDDKDYRLLHKSSSDSPRLSQPTLTQK